MTDKTYCDQCGARAVMLDNLREKDKMICKKLACETDHRETEERRLWVAISNIGTKIDHLTPRWAFLLLVSLLVVSLGYTNVSLISIDKKLAVVAQRLTGQELKLDGVDKTLESHIHRYQQDKYKEGP